MVGGARQQRSVRVRAFPGRRSPALASFLGILAILVNVTAPLGVSNPVRAAELATGGVTILCSAAGPIAVDAKGLPVPLRHPAPPCAFCLPLMQGALGLPDLTGSVLAWENRIVGEAFFGEQASLRQPPPRVAAPFARGPPFA